MRKRAKILSAIVAIAGMSVIVDSAAWAIGDTAPAGVAARVAEGERLYVRQGCYQCHGLEGQGSILTGPSLSPLRLSSGAFGAYVRNPKGAMPPFTKNILPDPELLRIEAYIRTFPRPTSYSAIPLLKRAAELGTESSGTKSGFAMSSPSGERRTSGRTLYAQSCAGCHGHAREGGVGPALAGEAGKRSLADTIQLILAPPGAMPKLFPDPLSQADVQKVARYIRSTP